MVHGRTCYCVNPHCQHRENVFHRQQTHCAHCGTPLVLEPHKLLLEKPLYGYLESDANSEVFLVDSFDFEGPSYPKILKILKSDFIPKAKELFQEEGNLLRQLRDFAVPQVPPQPYFQVTVNHPQTQTPMGSIHCLVMEKIEGKSLEEVLENGKISVDQAIDWLRQLGQLLFVVHGNQIIHRDIKPANIIVREKTGFPHGELVLIDFGAARRNTISYVNEVAAERSMTKIVSQGYTAPEQCQGRYNFQSDLFAVGRTMLHLLTDIYPDETTYKALDWQQFIPLAPLRKLLLTLTATDLKKRTANAKELLDEVSQLLRNLDRHPLLVWFSCNQRHLTRGLAIASVVSLLIPLGRQTALLLTPSAELYKVGQDSYNSGHYRKAAHYFRIVLWKDDPHYHVYAHRELANSLYALGQTSSAIELMGQAVALGNPQEEVTCRSASDLGYIRITTANLENRSTIQQAMESLTQAFNCDSQGQARSSGHRNLAALYYYSNQPNKAQEHLNQSLLINDQHPKSLCLVNLFTDKKQPTTTSARAAIDCLG